jgi:hypothetical protein
MKKLLLVFCLVPLLSVAQKNVFLTLTPLMEGAELDMAQVQTDLSGKKVLLDHFDYYLSSIVVVHDGGQELVLPQQVHLIEPDNFVVYLGYLNVNSIEAIRFGIGVPENLNTIAGADAIDISAYPEGHPLSYQDPTMHWGWSSGYMHMIIGGLVDSDADDVPNKAFELHNLGNALYSNVSLPVVATESYEDQLDIYLNCNVDVWLTDINLINVSILHGSAGANALVMKNVETEAVFTQPLTANVVSEQKIPGKVWFYNSPENLIVSWEGVKQLSSIELIDIYGRVVTVANSSEINGKSELSGVAAGTYQVLLKNTEGEIIKKINVVR